MKQTLLRTAVAGAIAVAAVSVASPAFAHDRDDTHASVSHWGFAAEHVNVSKGEICADEASAGQDEVMGEDGEGITHSHAFTQHLFVTNGHISNDQTSAEEDRVNG